MADILMVYGTSLGHTEKIVRRMAERLNSQGHRVTVRKADTEPSVAGYDAILVAGSVRFGRHQRSAEHFVRRNLEPLSTVPSAFVSVCGALAGSWSRGAERARGYVTAFLARTGWHPRLARSFGGALPYTQYDILTRWMMWLISRMTGRPTDTSRDWDLTDWDAVDRFADELGAVLRAPATGGAATAVPLSRGTAS
jgi:menaquinone-dependent protoporphyrinogen oxidase